MKRFAAIAVLSLAIAGAAGAAEQYVPGLGEFMSATQVRHAKLWFAGDAKNWELASFELDEITEGSRMRPSSTRRMTALPWRT
jgi:hypothetical protein